MYWNWKIPQMAQEKLAGPDIRASSPARIRTAEAGDWGKAIEVSETGLNQPAIFLHSRSNPTQLSLPLTISNHLYLPQSSWSAREAEIREKLLSSCPAWSLKGDLSYFFSLPYAVKRASHHIGIIYFQSWPISSCVPCLSALESEKVTWKRA